MNIRNTSPDGPLDASDASLLAELAALDDAVDPVPAGLAEEICLTLALRELDADLAAFERADGLAGVRSREYQLVASLTFSIGDWSMLVTVTPLDGTWVRLDGWVTAHGDPTVELRERSRTSTVTTQEGRFVFPRVERGLVQFVVGDADRDRPVITPHVEV